MILPIERNVPLPKKGWRYTGLTETLEALKEGESFIYHRASSAYGIAAKLGIKIRTTQLPDGTCRVYRLPDDFTVE